MDIKILKNEERRTKNEFDNVLLFAGNTGSGNGICVAV